MDEINCLSPGTLARIDGIAGVTTSSSVIPWLQTAAANDLAAAVSGVRTFVVRIYDASGAVLDARTVMLTLR